MPRRPSTKEQRKNAPTKDMLRVSFCEALARCANVSRACLEANLPRMTAYQWRARDEEFARMWDEALERGTDALEDEAIRRAHEGTLKPVYQGGKKVGDVREFSDTLMIFMLKARRPDRFKDRAVVEHDIGDNLAARLDAARAKRLDPPKS